MEASRSGSDWLASLLQRWVELVSPARDDGALPIRLSNEHARSVADEVLCAEDLEDLWDRLDTLAGDVEAWRSTPGWLPKPDGPSIDELVAMLDKGLSPALDIPSLVRVLGEAGANRCEEGHVAFLAVARRLVSVIPKVRPLLRAQAPTAPAATSGSPADWVFSATLPLGLRAACLRIARGLAASVAIARAEEKGSRLEPWLAFALADAFARAPEQALVAVSTFDDLVVDVATLPSKLASILSQLAETLEDKKAYDAAIERWRAEATKSEKGVYFPVRDGVAR